MLHWYNILICLHFPAQRCTLTEVLQCKSLSCAVHRAQIGDLMFRNGGSVYIWTCGVVKYCASGNVTPEIEHSMNIFDVCFHLLIVPDIIYIPNAAHWLGSESVVYSYDVVQHFSINLQGICECRTYIADFIFTFLSCSFTLATVGSTSGGVGSNLGSGGLSALCYQQHTCASNWQLWKHSVVFSDWNCVFFGSRCMPTKLNWYA